ncbi:hypothetical protein Tco_1164462 [Tanacetum coccineum]
MDLENDNNKVNISSGDIVIEQSDNGIDANVDTQSHEFVVDFETNHNIHRESFNMGDYFIMIKVMIEKHFHEGMPLIFIINNLYVPFGIPFNPKLFYKDGVYTKKLRRPSFTDMAPLPARDQRHLWLKYEGQEYTDAIIYDYEDMLGWIFGRHVNRVQVLDFEGLTVEIRHALTDQLRMVYIGTEGQILFTSDAWIQVFEIRRPLVLELMWALMPNYLEAVYFGHRHSPLLHFYLGPVDEIVPSIDCSISERGHAPENVTSTDLFYLRSMDEGTAVNVPYLLAQYLFRHAEGRKQGVRMSGGQFTSRLVEHFGLLTKERL